MVEQYPVLGLYGNGVRVDGDRGGHEFTTDLEMDCCMASS